MSSDDHPKPPVLIIAIGQEPYTPEFLAPLFSELHARASVTEVNNRQDSVAKLASINPHAVLITTADFVKRSNQAVIAAVADYADNGGTVVFCELPASYSMKAVHVKGASAQAAVYVTTSDSRIESHVFAPTPAHDSSQSPVLFESVGSGYVGYIGDVNAETESTAVVLAMCNLMGEGTCQVCGDVGNKKCARCLNARYCSRECQAKDWKTHKTVCTKS